MPGRWKLPHRVATGYAPGHAPSTLFAPFPVRRVFLTQHTPSHVLRGRHAHYALELVLLALQGSIRLTTEGRDASHRSFLLCNPAVGVYLPPDHWHTLHFSKGAQLLALASLPYDEADYIRSYAAFKDGV